MQRTYMTVQTVGIWVGSLHVPLVGHPLLIAVVGAFALAIMLRARYQHRQWALTHDREEPDGEDLPLTAYVKKMSLD